jgi:hypothetical protein
MGADVLVEISCIVGYAGMIFILTLLIGAP